MINPDLSKLEWTPGEVSKLGRMPHRALRYWLRDARLRRAKNPQRQSGEWHKLRFADVFHIIVVGYLVRYGASPEEASRVVSKHIDPRTRRIVMKGDSTATAELFAMTLNIRVKDNGKVESAEIAVDDCPGALGAGPGSDITQSDDHGAFVQIGAVIKELMDSIVAAETEQSKGSA